VLVGDFADQLFTRSSRVTTPAVPPYSSDGSHLVARPRNSPSSTSGFIVSGTQGLGLQGWGALSARFSRGTATACFVHGADDVIHQIVDHGERENPVRWARMITVCAESVRSTLDTRGRGVITSRRCAR
jgi:hypothetical protein